MKMGVASANEASETEVVFAIVNKIAKLNKTASFKSSSAPILQQ